MNHRLFLVGLFILTADDIRCWGFVSRPSSLMTKLDATQALLHKDELNYNRYLVVKKSSYNSNNNNWNQNFGGPPPPPRPPPPYYQYQNDPNYQGPYFDNNQNYDQRGEMYEPQQGRGLQQPPPWERQPQDYDNDDPNFYPPQNDNFGPYFDERLPPPPQQQQQQQRMPPPPNQRPLDSNYQQMNTRRDPTGSLGKPMGPSFGEKREDPRQEAIGPKPGDNRRFDSFQSRPSDARGPPQSSYGSPPPPRMDQRNDGQRMTRQPFEQDRGFNNNYSKNERSFRPDTSLNSNEASPSGASLFNPPTDPSRRTPNQRPLDSNYERATSRQDPFGSLGQPMGPSFSEKREDPREISVGPRNPNSGPPFSRQQQNPFERREDSFNQPPPFNMRPPDARQAPGSFYGAPPPPVGQRSDPRQPFNERGPVPNYNEERVFRPDNSLNANEAYRSASSYNRASAYQPRRSRSLGDPIGPSFADDRDQREVAIGPTGPNMGYRRGSPGQYPPPQAWGRSVGDPIGPSFADDKEPRETVIGPTNERNSGSRGFIQQSSPGAQERYRQPQEGQQSYTYRPADQTRPDAYSSNTDAYHGGASIFNPTREFTPRQGSRPLDSNYKPTKSRMDPVRSLGDPMGASFADVKEDPREILVGPKQSEKPPSSQQSTSSFGSNTAPSYDAQRPYSNSSENPNQAASYQQTDRSPDGRQETFYSESVYTGTPNEASPPSTPEPISNQSSRKDYSFFGSGGPGKRQGVNQPGVSPPFPSSSTNSNQNEGFSAPQAPQPRSSPSYYGGPPLRTGEPSRWQGGTNEHQSGAEEDEVSVEAEVINESGVSPPFPSQSSGYNPNPFNSGTTTGYRPESVYGGAGVGVRDSVNQVGVSPPFPKAQTFISEEEAEARSAEARKNEAALEHQPPTDPGLVPTGEEEDTREREFLWYHEKTYTVRYKN